VHWAGSEKSSLGRMGLRRKHGHPRKSTEGTENSTWGKPRKEGFQQEGKEMSIEVEGHIFFL